MLRFLTAGESHGKALVGILEGMPAGVPLCHKDFAGPMRERWLGYGRGARRNIERDEVEILAGVRFGRTMGTPIALLIWNEDHENWLRYMGAEGPVPEGIDKVTVPRPGHADFAGACKYHATDVRVIRERASARETAMRTALSVPVRNLLQQLGVHSLSLVTRIGDVPAADSAATGIGMLKRQMAKNDPAFRTSDHTVVETWKKLVDGAAETCESLGGAVEIHVEGLPVGLGSHVHWDRRLDTRISAALMSIPGVRAVEIGKGITQSRSCGSRSHDRLQYAPGRGYFRESNLAGGLEGGMTNGEPLILTCFMKPLPGSRIDESVELISHKPKPLFLDRSDTLAVVPLAVIAEALTLIEIGNVFLEKLGGDHLDDVRGALESYRSRLGRL